MINAQRDSFAVRPVDGIRAASKQLADVCDSVIQVRRGAVDGIRAASEQLADVCDSVIQVRRGAVDGIRAASEQLASYR